MRKSISQLNLILAVVFIVSSCVKSDITPGERRPVANDKFDWQTTTTTTIDVSSKVAGEETYFFVTDDNGATVFAGFTPFKGEVTLPSSTSTYYISQLPILQPIEDLQKNAKSRAASNVNAFTAGQPAVLGIEEYQDFHLKMWQEWVIMKHWGWEFFANRWNDFGVPGTTWKDLSGITLFPDRPAIGDVIPTGNGIYQFPHTGPWGHICDGGCSGEPKPEPPKEVTSNKFGTYMFEDLFPYKGDYDMNDLIVEENVQLTSSTENKLKRATYNLTLKASGSTMKLGLALSMPGITTASIKSVKLFRASGDSFVNYTCENTDNTFVIGTNNIEVSDKGEVVIPIFSNAQLLFTGGTNGNMLNTRLGSTEISVAPYKVEVEFVDNAINTAQFKSSLFVIKDSNKIPRRGIEVHIVDEAPTAKANAKLFGTGDDRSDATKGKYYRAADGSIWGLYIPVGNHRHPYEEIEIYNAYSGFRTWIDSNGDNAADWYKAPSDETKAWEWKK